MEIWKEVKDYEGLYEISNLGNAKMINGKNNHKPHKMSYSLDKDGYSKFRFTKNGKRKTLNAHRLIALHFIPNPENKPQVNHINGIKTDNRVENLEWCTNSENIIHSWVNGLSTPKRGESNSRSILTEDQVLEIRTIGNNLTLKNISEIYNISIMYVQFILKRKRWTHI